MVALFFTGCGGKVNNATSRRSVFTHPGVSLNSSIVTSVTPNTTIAAPATSTVTTYSTSTASSSAAPSTTTITPTTSTTTTTSIPGTSFVAKPVQIGYDIGYPTSTLAMGSIGYAVKFATNCTGFVVNRISIFGNLYGQDHTGMTFEIRIADENLNVLHSVTCDHVLFSATAKWISVDIPSVTTRGPFYVMIVTGSKPPPGAGISIGYDTTSSNQGSEVTNNWKLADWTKFIPQSPQKSRCNWMIRATGWSSDPATTVSFPLVFEPPSWKSMTFDQMVGVLDTPQKISASLVANFTPESHYDPTSTATLYISTPQEIYAQGKGSCNEYTVFSCYVLQQHSIDARILAVKVASNPGENHAVCIYTLAGVLYALNNGIITGPFADYAAIATAHDPVWSSYQVFNSWQTFRALGPPDTTVPKS
jgi:hypothetical protein